MPSSPARAESMMTGTPVVSRVGAQRARAGRSRRGRASSRRSGRGPAGRPRASSSAAAPSGGGLRRRSRRRAATRRTRACRRCRRRRGPAAASAPAPRTPSGGGGVRRRRRASASPRRGSPRPPRGGRRRRGRSRTTWSAGRCALPNGTATRERAALARRAVDRDRAAVQARPARPRAPGRCPVPSWVRERAPSTRWKRSNRCGSSAGSMPVPVSLTRQLGRAVGLARARTVIAALERELQRVREQVEHDLRPHARGRRRPARAAAGSRPSSVSPARSTAEPNMLASSAV